MSPFKSFLMAGYECADHFNVHGQKINLLFETEHHIRVNEDYKDLQLLRIKTVREGVCWSHIEKQPYSYDFSEVENRIIAAQENGIQQIWDLVHFGYPADIYPTHPAFKNRYLSFCLEFCKFLKTVTTEPPVIVPFNEISFVSWLSGEVGASPPYVRNSGWDIKYKICEAVIQGIKLIKEIYPEATILMVEPLVKVHHDDISGIEDAVRINTYQYQAIDIISGRICAELMGHPSLINIIGVNYYYNCQWIHGNPPLPWPDAADKRTPLSELILQIYHKYNLPVIISETGHFGDDRALWFHEIIREAEDAVAMGVNLLGICIYPVIDRPDWDNLLSYSNCGVWDLDRQRNRVLNRAYYEAIAASRLQIAELARTTENNSPAR